jgi:hypothetical protein
MKTTLVLALTLLTATAAAQPAPSTAPSGLPRTASAAGAEEYIISPKDGETVGQDLTVRFGLKGMGVAPAGVVKENTGHHHLLIDNKELPPLDLPIANDDTHKHYGGGQTEATIHLAPGDHTLQLLLGDASHIPLNPSVMSKKITVHVK